MRKGKTINVFEFDSVTVKLDGQRGGSGIHATITWDNLSHDESVGVDLPKGSVDSKAKEGQVEAEKTLTKDGEVVERVSNVTAIEQSQSQAATERAMRTHEMLLKLVNRKGEPLAREKVAQLCRELTEK